MNFRLFFVCIFALIVTLFPTTYAQPFKTEASDISNPACRQAGAQNKEITVTATDISNRLYYPAVISEITNAKDEIYVAMYSMYVRPTEPDSPLYKNITYFAQSVK